MSSNMELALKQDIECLPEIDSRKKKCIFIRASDRNFIALLEDCMFKGNTIKCDKVYSGNDLDRFDLDSIDRLYFDEEKNRIYKCGCYADFPIKCFGTMCIIPEYFVEVDLDIKKVPIDNGIPKYYTRGYCCVSSPG